MTIGIIIAVLLLIDWYAYQAISTLLRDGSSFWRGLVRYAWWGLSAVSVAIILLYNFGNPDWFHGVIRSLIFSFLLITYFSKVLVVLFIFVDDVVRLGKWAISFFQNPKPSGEGQPIARSDFLMKTAVIAGSVPLLTMSWGIISGAHDYRIRRKTVYLPNLPKAFDGLRIGQLSDIHTGSFFNKTAVKGGVEMLMKEKADMVFFTGDLVNNESKEVEDYIDIFNKVKAPLGVFSSTGNHDYGDYKAWSSVAAKQQNFKDLIEAHKLLGYDLLMNENRIIEEGGEKLAIIGVENWGKGRFAKYGKLDEAVVGSQEASVKLLLSHDPSHWDAQVRPNHPDIDLMFAGHTHGFQFGIEAAGIKWSPSQYAYKQWAGLYTEEEQHLYVNRGYGYIGYPGRIGMLPEITIVTLKRGVGV